jgi:hypothetical protein
MPGELSESGTVIANSAARRLGGLKKLPALTHTKFGVAFTGGNE